MPRAPQRSPEELASDIERIILRSGGDEQAARTAAGAIVEFAIVNADNFLDPLVEREMELAEASGQAVQARANFRVIEGGEQNG